MGEQGHRLFVLGYPDAALADAAIAELDQLAQDEFLRDVDWAVVTKGADGKVTTRESTSADAGPARGAVAGGVAGALIAIAGPIGLAGVAAAAGVGAVVAALHDSGFKDKDLTSVADLMTEGRTVLILDVGPEYVDKMRSALTDVPEFLAADRTLESPVDGRVGQPAARPRSRTTRRRAPPGRSAYSSGSRSSSVGPVPGSRVRTTRCGRGISMPFALNASSRRLRSSPAAAHWSGARTVPRILSVTPYSASASTRSTRGASMTRRFQAGSAAISRPTASTTAIALSMSVP